MENIKSNVDFLVKLQGVIQDRKINFKDESYTCKLFKKGTNKVIEKFGEEAIELIIEAKDKNQDLFLNEAADVLFHYLVLLTEKEYTIEQVIDILKQREK